MSNLLLSGIDVSDFCTDAKDILQFVGYILTFFKVAIPLVIIALGMFDFGKAVVASKEDEIKKQTTRLLYRAVAGVVIFFIPTIVLWLFRAVGNYEEEKDRVSFKKCETCVLSPWDCNK